MLREMCDNYMEEWIGEKVGDFGSFGGQKVEVEQKVVEKKMAEQEVVEVVE